MPLLDRDDLAAVALVLVVRKLDVQVGDVQAAQLLGKVLVVAGGLFRDVHRPVKGAPGGEAHANLRACTGHTTC